MNASLKIVRLEAENVKRLVAVEVEPDGSLVLVGGKNGAGKSSLLDSIAYALGGQALVCERPLRDGAERGHVEVDLGELVVRREFTAGGTSRLTVTSREGARFPSPQAMLDKLIGRLSFDPLAFTRMKPADQVETLRGLVGLDFAGADREREEAYAARTAANRAAKSLSARLAALPQHVAPAEEVSVAALMEELDAITQAERACVAATARRAAAGDELRAIEARIAGVRDEIEKLEERLSDLTVAREKLVEVAEDLAEQAIRARQAVPDAEPVRARIEASDETNRKVRENRHRESLAAELAEVEASAARLTAELEAIDAGKAAQLSAAKFPVDGLSFDAERVLFRGVPFEQASSAEQIRVSMAMAFAANPRLRIALIRDASLLDADSLALVARMAEEADAQVWLEVVRTDAGCSVVIEDGRVA